MLASMTPRLTIDWEPHARPVTGEVTGAAMPPRGFTGWLELLALLRAAVAADDDVIGTKDHEEEEP
jgi:hypothetical protein